MTAYDIDVNEDGAVRLGRDVVCDGFVRACSARVQSHVHSDHMDQFDTSKGFHDLIMSEETFALLASEERHMDLLDRENLYSLAPGQPLQLVDSHIQLLPNFHMLGSVQVLVETKNGLRLGYSGDFSWPIEPSYQMECDALVVDATYGSPTKVREYSQGDAEECLAELVSRKLHKGPVILKAHRGTIQRALQVLAAETDCPIICSEKLSQEISVYQRFGSAVGSVVECRSAAARELLKTQRYIRLYSTGDQVPAHHVTGTTIVLSAFMSRHDTPLLEYSERAYRIALSNHADFSGTLEYVEATGARYVVTDNSRGGNGEVLAAEIRTRLGIASSASSGRHSDEWGA